MRTGRLRTSWSGNPNQQTKLGARVNVLHKKLLRTPKSIDALADELNLLKTGGSDFHGRPHDVVELGEMGLTEKQYVRFKQSWQQLRGQAR